MRIEIFTGHRNPSSREAAAVHALQDVFGDAHDIEIVDVGTLGINTTADDVIIDLSGGILARALASLPGSMNRASVLELWFGDAPTTLDFDKLAEERRPGEHGIVWTVKSSDGSRSIVNQSTVLWTPPSAAPNRDRAAGRSVALLVRALRSGVPRPGGLPWADQGDQRSGLPLARRLAPVVDFAARATNALRRRWSRQDVWFMAWRPRSPGTGTAAGDTLIPPAATPPFRPWGTSRERFAADPCAIRYRGTTYIFYEDYVYAKGRGEISCTSVDPSGRLTEPVPVLQSPWHLSYPFVFEHDGVMYMIPESAQARRVDLYRAVEFPRRWELRATLLEGRNAVDATLHFDGRLWWMFTSIGEFGGSTWDELFLFFAEDPVGPWTPHPGNPVKTGYQSSRPAGRLLNVGGRLIRPTQDCSRGYGRAIRFCEVETLTTEAFAEREIGAIDSAWLGFGSGIHTFTETADIQVVDGKWDRVGPAHSWPGFPASY